MDAYIALFQAAARPLLICAVATSALLGVLALVSPKAFTLLAVKGNRWIDTSKLFHVPDNKLFRTVDKWVETDQFTLRYSRLTGIVMIVAAAIVGSLYLIG